MIMRESRIKDIQRQTGFNKKTKRSPADFYRTPAVAVMELLKRETFEGLGWEPACGDGAISKFFPNIISSDIRTDPDITGEIGIDFLNETRKVDYIVTNPPFSLMLHFAQHALKCADKIALFGRIQFLEGVKRYIFFKENPPKRIYVFANRLSCASATDSKESKSGGIMCFCWFIWEKGYKGKPTIDWILWNHLKVDTC